MRIRLIRILTYALGGAIVGLLLGAAEVCIIGWSAGGSVPSSFRDGFVGMLFLATTGTVVGTILGLDNTSRRSIRISTQRVTAGPSLQPVIRSER